MLITNLKYYHDLDFEDYLTLPGTSYSGIKNFTGTPNAGMSLGKKVHAYLLEPDTYTWEDAATVRKIAAAILPVLGSAIKYLDKEVSFTCDMEYNGMVLKYKGRTDLIKIGRIILDLKILSGALIPAVQRFGYEDQLSGYCIATATPLSLIVAYNRNKEKVETYRVTPNLEFWQYQVVHRGLPK